MMDSDKRIGNYAIDAFIGYGASSAVFKGVDLNCRAHGVAKNVAVKFIWDREMALEEVRRLERTHSVFEICDLITYDEIPGRKIRELIGDTIEQLEKAMNCPLPIEDDQLVGMLILKLINGEHLIDRALYRGEPLNPDYEWTVSFEHPEIGEQIVLKEWLTPVARRLTIEQRLEILLQLTKALHESHRQGVVHGDLNPWNVFYEPETGRISIIDLGRNNFGVQGWRSPEHLLLMTEEIDSLPVGADIRLLGQWMRYLLPKKGPWCALAESCYHEDPARRPTTGEMVKGLKSFLSPKPRRRLMAVAVLFSLTIMAGIFAWQQRTPFTLKVDGYNRIAVLPYTGSPMGRLVAEMVNKSLETTEVLDTIRFSEAQKAARDLGIHGDADIALMRKVVEALGVQFVLTGSIEESETGSLTWSGTLLQRDGAMRRLSARGQNTTMLSGAIALICLRLLGSSESPIPPSELFSTDHNANFLYSYGNEFFNEGNFNAAFPLYQKALEFDPNFNHARAKLAFCHYLRGNTEESESILVGLLDAAVFSSDHSMLAQVYNCLVRVYRANGELDKAGAYLQDAFFQIPDEKSKNRAPLYTIDALIKSDMGDFQGSARSGQLAKEILEESGDQLSKLYNYLMLIHIYELRQEWEQVRLNLDEALALARKHGIKSFEARFLVREARMAFQGPVSALDERLLNKLYSAREMLDAIGDDRVKLDAEFHIAKYFFLTNQFKTAREEARRLWQAAKLSGDDTLEIRTLLLLFDIAHGMADYENMKMYLNELMKGKKGETRKRQLFVFGRLWWIKAHLGDYEGAKAVLTRLEALSEDDEMLMGLVYNNLGEVYDLQGSYGRARELYQISLDIKKSRNDAKGITWTLRNFVMLSIKQNRLKEARFYMDELRGIDAEEFQTRIVFARLAYAEGAFEDAHQILLACKNESIEGGRWHDDLEASLLIYQRAVKEKRRLPLPDRLGNQL